jgi:CoA:oxalate CoA-transferase
VGQASESAGRKPLSGLKVLDFTRVLSGPYCTALMADLGADVVKIESPNGDDYRHIGPFVDGESALFQNVNRAKRSIALDLKAARSIEIVRALVETADVVVENFRPGVMDRLGLGWDALSALNPRLVYVSVSGFGQTGPNVARPAYDIIVQAMSGLMSVTGEPDGPPTMVGEAIADVAGGLFAAWGCMVALFERERTGVGRHVDLALFDALLAMTPTAACRHLIAGEAPARVGNRHALSAPFGVYSAGQGREGEGHFAVAVLNEKLFGIFAETIGRPDLAQNPDFATDALRRRHEPALAEAIEAWAAELGAAEAVSRLNAAGVPASEIASVAEAWSSEQASARGLASPVAHPTLGALMTPEQPVHFSGVPRGGRRAAPALNEHEGQILRELGWEDRT